MTPHVGKWEFDPGSGGMKIPTRVQADVTRRINQVAEEQFKGRYTRLDIRFRSQFCYIDAYTEPRGDENWPPPGWEESHAEMIERLRNTPIHLCRLRYLGNDRWSYAFYAYSSEKYELSIFPNGEFTGSPEDAFLASSIYLLDEGS